MKVFLKTVFLAGFGIVSLSALAQSSAKGPMANKPEERQLFLDVHHLTPGKVNEKAVADAHAKDLAVEGKYNVDFLRYWVDTKKGLVFCLASSSDSESIRKTHAEAHGLLPDRIYPVTEGTESPLTGKKNLYLDVHYLGAGKVTARDVAGAHLKDLATQDKYRVNFINYWVNEQDGVVMCLAEAKDSASLSKTHKEAHGLLPDRVFKVQQGQ